MQDIIILKQLPIIEETLKNVSQEVDKRIAEVTSLVCTEDTKTEVKKARAQLSKDFLELENQRKLVKTQINKPYDEFFKIYKELITDKFLTADDELKDKINEIENIQKSKIQEEVITCFEELKKAKNIDFIELYQVINKINLSDSITSLKKRCLEFLERVESDIDIINGEKHKDEILYEYKKSLSVADSIITVERRRKTLDSVAKTTGDIQDNTPDNTSDYTTLQAPKIIQNEQEIFVVKFSVKATKSKLKELKNFLEKGEYEYE